MRNLEGIVIHRAEVMPNNREYHVLVEKDGSKVRLVADEQIAPHARHFNPTTLAIAVFGDFAADEPGANWTPTEAQYETVIEQCRDWIQDYGALWIKGHSELGLQGTAIPEKLVKGHTCPGERFDLDRVREACENLGNSTPDSTPEGGGSIRA